MLVNKIKQWIDNEEEWFINFLTEMTKNEICGDDLSGYDVDDVDFDIDTNEICMRYDYSTRCGDSDSLFANIPVEHVIRKLRKDKLDLIKNN